MAKSSSSSSSTKHLLFLFQLFLINFSLIRAATASKNAKLFREYIGAEGNNVKFSDVPVSPNVYFHYILSFAIDYTNSKSPQPTNGNFNIFWDKKNLNPSQVYSIKARHRNIKVAMSLGGDTVSGGHDANFSPVSVTSWVKNAVVSVTKIVKEYHLDGIDIDYEHFSVDPNTFAECIGRLVLYLKQHKIVSFVSIAPYDEDSIKSHYLALWKKYGYLIDYVNFQFYAYDKGTTVPMFLQYFNTQSKNYKGSNLLVSFGTDNDSGGLKPDKGFFKACSILQSKGLLHGIFVWSADDSKKTGFRYEKQAQKLLASKKMLY